MPELRSKGVLVLMVIVPEIFAAESPQKALIGLGPLRHSAVFAPLPAYPVQSVRRNSQGVVVVQIEVGTSGQVADLHILETPDEFIGSAVAGTIKKWRFNPAKRGDTQQPLIVVGRLIVYYRIVNGKPTVEDAGLAINPAKPPK
jgi:TonB family protein